VPQVQDEQFVDATGHRWPKLPPHTTGLWGRCPRCGRGHIFTGLLKIRERCEVCGLDYSYADPADGPAVFVQLFACVPGVVFVLLLAILWDPPFWVYLAVGLPIIVATTVLPLRPIKGWLVASQFYFKAQEGRLVRPSEE
jgi:uncharacterized protein (DUF983 family)